MNRSRPRTYQFSQSFIRVSSVEEFAKLDNSSSFQDAQNNQHSQQLQSSQGAPENNENSNNNIQNGSYANSQPFQGDLAISGKINPSNNAENTITPAASVSNPSNNNNNAASSSAAGSNSASIFTAFSGPGQSSQYSKIAFGMNGAAFGDKGAGAENPEKKRKIQGYSYIRLRHEQNLPKPEAYELRDQDIEFLTSFNKESSQNMRTENPSKYEELFAQQKQRYEDTGALDGGEDSSSNMNFGNGRSCLNDGTITLLTEDQLEKLFVHFEKRSTRDTTATLQEIKIDLPKEYEDRLGQKELEVLYQYWRREREKEYERQGEKSSDKLKELYPFMRKYWRASTEDISAHAAFRPREANRMRTRKSARPENKETYEKMLSLEGDFKKYRLLALNLKKRELLKRELAYITITEFNKSIPGLSNEFSIYNKFVSRDQEIKQISNLIQPKPTKSVKNPKPKVPKPDVVNKEAVNEQKDANEEIMNADDSNVIKPTAEIKQKGIKISLTKMSGDHEKKSKLSDEAKKIQANGEIAEVEDAPSNIEKPVEEDTQVVPPKKKKQSQKKKEKKQKAKEEEEANQLAQAQLEVESQVEKEDPNKEVIPPPPEKKKSKKKKKVEVQSEVVPSEEPVVPEEQPEKNGDLEKPQPDETEKQEEPGDDTKKKPTKKKSKVKEIKDPKDPKEKEAKKRNKKKSTEMKMEEELSTNKPHEENTSVQNSPKNSQSIHHEVDFSAAQEKLRKEESQIEKKKRRQRKKTEKAEAGVEETETNQIAEPVREKVLSVSVPIPIPQPPEIISKNVPLIKLDKEQETAQFLSSFVIYFHQFKLPITLDNVDSSEKIANKNQEMQEEKKQKLKNPNTLAYLIRKRVGRSNRSYIDRTFDSLNEVIGIQSGKISYLLTPHRNEVIYNTFNYINPDAVKTISSSQFSNSNNPANPLSQGNTSSILPNNTNAQSGAGYDEESAYNNKRESKATSDKKQKILPGNERLISEVREKQRSLFRSSLFQSKQEKIKAVIQQPYIQEMERRRKRTHLQAFFHKTQQLWIEDDGESDNDEIFTKSIQSLKQNIEEKQKEKEKKQKQMQKALADQLKKQKEEAARLQQQQQKEEAQRLEQQQQQQQQSLQQSQQQPQISQPQFPHESNQFPNNPSQQSLPFNGNMSLNNNPSNLNLNSSNGINPNSNNNLNSMNNMNSNPNLSNQYYPDQPYLYEQNSNNNFNQPPLQHNQSSMNYYNNFDRGSFDQGPSNLYGQNNQMLNPQNMDMMQDEIFSPMQIGGRQHQSSFQGGDLPNIQSQPNLNQQMSNNFNDGNFSYYDNEDNPFDKYDNGFNNQPNQMDNNYYNYNNEYMNNENDIENSYIAGGENNINNYMDDDI